MPEPLKNRYNQTFFQEFADIADGIIPGFDRTLFFKKIFHKEWSDLELKDRMRHSAESLHEFMPLDFRKSVKLLVEITKELQKRKLNHLALEYMFIPEYIERYGLSHFESSMNAIEEVTQFTSCEFAVRPFYIKYPEKMLAVMISWSKSKSKDVRRLSTEGSRPRLPWAIALPEFKSDPKPIMPILEQLKNDPSEYVRRSVANNINDIAKDNPHLVISICKDWKGKSKETDALLKHGSRTLLKAGHPEIMSIFGFDGKNIQLKDFKISTPIVKIGTKLSFEASIKNLEEKPKIIRLEFAVYYLRKNGSHNKKVFKISEKKINPKVEVKIMKSQSINYITTRKYYEGEHYLSLIYNGVETKKLKFILTK